jgi:hypothetical protein
MVWTERGQARAIATTALVVVLASIGLTACTSPARPHSDGYTWDTRLNKLPTIGGPARANDLLPANVDYHVVASAETKDGMILSLAIKDGHCYTTLSGPGSNSGVGADAPKAADNDVHSQDWSGERKVIGPDESVSSSLGKFHYVLDCGDRGAWVGIPLPKKDLTIAGNVSLPASAQGPSKTGLVVVAG